MDEIIAQLVGEATVTPLGGSWGLRLVRVAAADGALYALKWGAHPLPGALSAEARGLALLGSIGALRLPRVVACAESDGDHPGYLLMEWLGDRGVPRAPDQAALGSGLALLHRAGADRYGLDHDNYIGGTPQLNTPAADWIAFFRARRLLPQLALAERNNLLDRHHQRAFARLIERLDGLLAIDERCPSLLHGDLWSGNVVATDSKGTPGLIDPAVFYGDRESDLAFSELFGGFSHAFYAAYDEAWPRAPGYAERAPIYNLYHLLNHLNLFGASYRGSIEAILRHYVCL